MCYLQRSKQSCNLSMPNSEVGRYSTHWFYSAIAVLSLLLLLLCSGVAASPVSVVHSGLKNKRPGILQRERERERERERRGESTAERVSHARKRKPSFVVWHPTHVQGKPCIAPSCQERTLTYHCEPESRIITSGFCWGLPYMTSAKFSDFSTLSPPCHCHKSADCVPFVCFLGTLLPNPLRTSYTEAPLPKWSHT